MLENMHSRTKNGQIGEQMSLCSFVYEFFKLLAIIFWKSARVPESVERLIEKKLTINVLYEMNSHESIHSSPECWWILFFNNLNNFIISRLLKLLHLKRVLANCLSFSIHAQLSSFVLPNKIAFHSFLENDWSSQSLELRVNFEFFVL